MGRRRRLQVDKFNFSSHSGLSHGSTVLGDCATWCAVENNRLEAIRTKRIWKLYLQSVVEMLNMEPRYGCINGSTGNDK